MIKTVIQSAIFLIVMSIICGVLYPLLITGVSALFWSQERHGALIKKDDIIIGSSKIGQKFLAPEYFWPRPSASDYSAMPGAGSNLGPTSKKLLGDINQRSEMFAREAKVFPQEVPEILVTSSASGLDPDIFLPAALFQAERVSKARKLNKSEHKKLLELIESMAKSSSTWLNKRALINVLALNLALDEAFGKISR